MLNKTVAIVDPNHIHLGYMGNVTDINNGLLTIEVDSTFVTTATQEQVEIVDNNYLK